MLASKWIIERTTLFMHTPEQAAHYKNNEHLANHKKVVRSNQTSSSSTHPLPFRVVLAFCSLLDLHFSVTVGIGYGQEHTVGQNDA